MVILGAEVKASPVYVADLDAARKFYCDKLELIERGVDVFLQSQNVTEHYDKGIRSNRVSQSLVLKKAENKKERGRIGRRKVVLVLTTDDFLADYKDLREKGVQFRNKRRDMPRVGSRQLKFWDEDGNALRLREELPQGEELPRGDPGRLGLKERR